MKDKIIYRTVDRANRLTKKQRNIMKKLFIVSLLTVAAFFACLGLASCNVTRTVTTQSQYYTKGDTTCTIITKTIESYDATKKQ